MVNWPLMRHKQQSDLQLKFTHSIQLFHINPCRLRAVGFIVLINNDKATANGYVTRPL